jgi:hypothetical protein
MDAIIAGNVPKTEERIPFNLRENIFLQTWKTFRGHQRWVPPTIRCMLGTARKYGVRLETLAVDQETMRQMPIWMHNEANKNMRRLTISKASTCLQQNHQVYTVGDAECLAQSFGRSQDNSHFERDECECEICCRIETEHGCKTPNSCINLAKKLIDTLPDKWNPTRTQTKIEQQINPTQENAEEALQALGETVEDDQGQTSLVMTDWIQFDREIKPVKTLRDAFRIFTKGNTYKSSPKLDMSEAERELVIIGTDGSCENNRSLNA